MWIPTPRAQMGLGLVKCELFRGTPSLRWVQVGPLNPLLEIVMKSAMKCETRANSISGANRHLVFTCTNSWCHFLDQGPVGYPKVAKQRCMVAQRAISSSISTKEPFSKRSGNLGSYWVFRTWNLGSNGRTWYSSQIDSQTDRQTGRQTDRPTDRQTDKQERKKDN